MKYTDGKPCDWKLSRTVWGGGKSGDNTKGLPIAIQNIMDDLHL